MAETGSALAIFSRYPRLGEVKTRLEPFLGKEACLKLHTAFLLDTLERTAPLSSTRYLYLAECSDQELADFSDRHPLSSSLRLQRQKGADLGQRLWNAYQEIARESSRVAFVGSDSPTLPLGYIQEALKRLLDFPVVVGPSDDGGYYLLGLSRSKPELFTGIPWGTAEVCRLTLARLREEEYSLLPGWYDVDTCADWERLRKELKSSLQGFPCWTSRCVEELTG